MKVCLVTASTYNGLDTTDGQLLVEDSPLGVLSLAAVLRAHGTEVAMCDLTHFLREQGPRGTDGCTTASEWIRATGADVYAFGTICSTYPLALRLATDVRRHLPGAPIILGGPQATVTDRLVFDAFPAVDIVVRGEAEYVLPEVIGALRQGKPLEGIGGITWRDGETIRRAGDAPLIADLDALPDAAYDLDVLLRRRAFISLELGRGCPFACEFCSTNDFFRRKFRLKSPHRVVDQMLRLRAEYGHTRFSLVHDMFTVDRRKVIAFCEAMRERGQGLTWSCSARTDCVDPELLETMAAAGCVGVFFGIESGSPDQQRRMRKFLDVEQARQAVECASRNGITNTVSLIVGFPDETPDDFRQTIDFMLDAARHDRAEPQLHLLAPLAGTPLALRHRKEIALFDEIYSDASVSAAGLASESPEHRLIVEHPDLFINFYLMPMQQPPRFLHEARMFLSHGLRRGRWLLVALHQEAGGIVGVLHEWSAWRRKPAATSRYYHDHRFVHDLLEFVAERYGGRGYHATDVLLGYLRQSFAQILAAAAPGGTAKTGAAAHATVVYGEDAIPRLAPGLRLLEVKGSVPAAIRALKAGRPFDPRSAPQAIGRRTHLLVRQTLPAWSELTELSTIGGTVLQLCDGARRVADVIGDYGRSGPAFAGASPEAVCDLTLKHMADKGLVCFYAHTCC
jgi:radical SAM superfamily enzyme YgiQ (UPF0313 family)